MVWSLIIPKVGAVHISGLFRIIGRSEFYRGNAIHFQESTYVGKSIRNGLGEPNHYTPKGISCGYSRKKKQKAQMIQYDRKGRIVGTSRYILFVWIHSGPIAKGGFFISNAYIIKN